MAKNSQIICRVCLRKCKTRHVSMKDTFPMDRIQEMVIYAKAYTTCTQLDVVEASDGLPEWLCNSCSRDLQYAYEFRDKAIQSFQKLRSQVAMQTQENAARAVSPSEFELPDNNAAVAYMRADADVIDACSAQIANCAKDPLVDSESDNEMLSHWKIPESKLKSPASTQSVSDIVYDSEDEKPLQHLITINKEHNLEKQELYENDVDSAKTGLVLPANQLLYDDDDEFRADDNPYNEKPDDAMFSPQAYIFPKGRFKCVICAQCYFTTIGLKAHMEVHLAKSATIKKKRARNKQRKISIKYNSDVAVHTLDANCDHSNSQQETLINSNTVSGGNEEGKQQPTTKMRKIKEPKPKRMFPCHVCGKHMISASKLRYHMVMHTGEKDYLCTMCPKAYSTIYALKHHIRTHTGERPYECKFCGDRFLRPTTLKSHQRRHTGERPYGCNICGKRFIQHSSMTTHMKLNHMDKTIKCPHCDKKYARQTDLNTHLLSHTGDKPYPCQLCPSRFVRQANLNKHMNQQHAVKAGTSNAPSASTASKTDNNGVLELDSSKSALVANLVSANENELIAMANNIAMDNSIAASVAKLIPISSQHVKHHPSEQSAHMLAIESFEHFDSDDLVPWNC